MSSNILLRCAPTNQTYQTLRKLPMRMQVRYVEKAPMPPGRIEQVDKLNMPGFVNPDKPHDEGHFTQAAKQQLEELKKKLDKPKVEKLEKK